MLLLINHLVTDVNFGARQLIGNYESRVMFLPDLQRLLPNTKPVLTSERAVHVQTIHRSLSRESGYGSRTGREGATCFSTDRRVESWSYMSSYDALGSCWNLKSGILYSSVKSKPRGYIYPYSTELWYVFPETASREVGPKNAVDMQSEIYSSTCACYNIDLSVLREEDHQPL